MALKFFFLSQFPGTTKFVFQIFYLLMRLLCFYFFQKLDISYSTFSNILLVKNFPLEFLLLILSFTIHESFFLFALVKSLIIIPVIKTIKVLKHFFLIYTFFLSIKVFLFLIEKYSADVEENEEFLFQSRLLVLTIVFGLVSQPLICKFQFNLKVIWNQFIIDKTTVNSELEDLLQKGCLIC